MHLTALQAARWFRQYHRDQARHHLTDARMPQDAREHAALGERKAAIIYSRFLEDRG